MFEGSFVAIITPFKNGKVDEEGLRNLIEFQITNGTNGIVPCGTTGESATLDHEEHSQVISIVVDACKGRVPVLAGTGSNSTKEAIKLTKEAEKAKANGALLITPYYNKPTQEGLYRHFEAVAKETSLPIVLYNVPSRTSVNMLSNTVKRLSEIKNFVGIKEASGSLQQMSEIVDQCEDSFSLISGDDPLLLPILSIGGKGVISVTANVAPDKVSKLCAYAAKNEMVQARKLHFELMELNNAMFIETNPIPVKTALGLMGKIDPELRPPLSSISQKNFESLKTVLRKYSLIG